MEAEKFLLMVELANSEAAGVFPVAACRGQSRTAERQEASLLYTTIISFKSTVNILHFTDI